MYVIGILRKIPKWASDSLSRPRGVFFLFVLTGSEVIDIINIFLIEIGQC
jgi:hypothetical protein